MKIAFIVHVFPRLSETFILNQITGLIDLGHEVDIFAELDPGEGKVHQQVEEYQLLRQTHYFIDSKQKWSHRRKYLLLLLKNLHKSPAKIIRALIVAKRFKIRPREALRYVIPFLGKDYDIIHCQFATLGNIGIFLKEVGISGKVVASFRGFDASRIVKANPRIYDDLFERGDLMLPNCNWFRKRLIDLGCNDEKILIHHSGIDVEKFTFTERHLEEGSNINLLTVARLTEKKGIEYSLRAVAKLLPKYPRLFYRIAGEGELRAELEALAAQLGLKEHVKFLGYVDHGEVKSLMMVSHIFVLASVISENGDEEGPSNVLNEAMASGMPVLGTDQTGFNEVVMDGVSGFLVPERDADALADRLDYLIQHPELWMEMARAGRKYVEEHSDTRKLNQRLVEIYRRLMEERDCAQLSL
jgi:colanic acid/amylovoran biosynthesis glycosyltransferase